MLLYVNCCPRTDSRTKRLAGVLLEKLGPYQERNLYRENLQPLNAERLAFRTGLLEKADYSHPIFDYAKEFASADEIVIAAPFWDLSFPSLLKIYVENIYVTGVVTRYDENGVPRGLCRAKKLWYVTTAGGPYDGRYSFEYLKTLATDYFGIPEAELVKAEMLDLIGNDPEQLLSEAMEKIRGE